MLWRIVFQIVFVSSVKTEDQKANVKICLDNGGCTSLPALVVLCLVMISKWPPLSHRCGFSEKNVTSQLIGLTSVDVTSSPSPTFSALNLHSSWEMSSLKRTSSKLDVWDVNFLQLDFSILLHCFVLCRFWAMPISSGRGGARANCQVWTRISICGLFHRHAKLSLHKYEVWQLF